MGHSSIRLKARRRKVANLAANSRMYSVKNCTIPPAKKEEIIEIKMPWGIVRGTKWHGYKIPDEGYPQPKPMMKKHTEWIYDKESRTTKKICVPSTFPTKKYDDYQRSLWKNLGKAAKMELYAQDKLKKWERKNPKPCADDDLFKDEMIPKWEFEREQALIRIRDFVVSMFDKVPLTGRYKQSENKYNEELIAELPAKNGEGHKVNELKKDSKLLKKAQEKVNKAHAKHTNLVCGNLRDHTRHKGRIILPQAA